MKCFSCQTVVPMGVTIENANFCVECGHALTQICPYEAKDLAAGADIQNIRRLPLCDDVGRATASCPSCGGLFKGCDTCLRLYELKEVACTTEGCPGTLREPISPFPSSTGPLDGTHCIAFPATLDSRAKQIAYPSVEELQALAYRYGMLVGASRRHLICWDWNGQSWQQQTTQALAATGDQQIHSLQIEQGRVFLLGQDSAMVFSLIGGVSKLLQQPGHFAFQSVGPRWWVRVSQPNTLRLTDCENWETHTVLLPAEAGEVTALAMATHLVLGTANGYLYRLDLQTRQLTSYANQKCSWVRLAVNREEVVALGYDRNSDAGRMTLMLYSLEGQTILGQRSLEPGCLGDFAWSGNRIYIARQRGMEQSSLETYNTLQLTQTPKSVNLSTGLVTQVGMFALTNPQEPNAGARLLLHRTDISDEHIVLVNPVTGLVNLIEPILGKNNSGLVDAIDGWPGEAPLLCIVDNHLIVASRYKGQTQLRTFEF